MKISFARLKIKKESMIMRGLIAGIIAAMFIVFSLSIARAHTPAKIEITYDPLTKVVTAVITHPVGDPARHYIYKVDVGLNGREILSHKISRQDNANTQTTSYMLGDYKPGDLISVEAYCSVNGTLTERFAAE